MGKSLTREQIKKIQNSIKNKKSNRDKKKAWVNSCDTYRR